LITPAAAADFDSAIRRFDPSRPSQPYQGSGDLLANYEKGPLLAGFSISAQVSELPNWRIRGPFRQKSPATTANIPVLQRLSAETGFDRDCRPRAGKLAVFSTSVAAASAAVSHVLPPDRGIQVFSH
jgi:hypothetical protein